MIVLTHHQEYFFGHHLPQAVTGFVQDLNPLTQFGASFPQAQADTQEHPKYGTCVVLEIEVNEGLLTTCYFGTHNTIVHSHNCGTNREAHLCISKRISQLMRTYASLLSEPV